MTRKFVKLKRTFPICNEDKKNGLIMTIHFDRIFFTKLTSFTFHKIVKIVTFHFDEKIRSFDDFRGSL